MSNDDLANTESASSSAGHRPVLAEQVLSRLAPSAGQVFLDCTIGRGGHAAMIAPRLGPDGRLIGLDVDPANVAFAAARLAESPCRAEVHHASFAEARRVLDTLKLPGVDGLLADLGFASNQMDDPDRGLSFRTDGPLDMRLDPTVGRTAADLVNELPQQELADLIYHFGQERLSRKIARKIIERRDREPILTTKALAELVRRAYGPSGRRIRIDPATRTFMALRIAVNDELGALRRLLEQMPRLLNTDATAAIISFHSLEDRLVKRAFADWHKQGLAERLTTKPLGPDEDERRDNPRSRSAKMRAIRWKGPR